MLFVDAVITVPSFGFNTTSAFHTRMYEVALRLLHSSFFFFFFEFSVKMRADAHFYTMSDTKCLPVDTLVITGLTSNVPVPSLSMRRYKRRECRREYAS